MPVRHCVCGLTGSCDGTSQLINESGMYLNYSWEGYVMIFSSLYANNRSIVFPSAIEEALEY